MFNKNDPEDVDTYLDFLQYITHGDYTATANCLRIVDAASIAEQEKMYRLLASLSELQASARYSRFLIRLEDDGAPELPDSHQYAIVSDSSDGTEETVTLRGGRNLRTDELHPRAMLADNINAWVLPSSIAISTANPPTVALTFTSPTTLSPLYTPPGASGGKEHLARLELVWGPDGDEGKCGSAYHQCYTNFLEVKAQAAPGSVAASVPTTCAESKSVPVLTATSTILRPTRGPTGAYTATVNIAVSDLQRLAQDCSTTSGNNQTGPLFQAPLGVVVRNADVVNIAYVTDTNECMSNVNNQIDLSSPGNCMVTLTLDNLTDGVPVCLTVQDSTRKTLPGDPLILKVRHVPQRR